MASLSEILASKNKTVSAKEKKPEFKVKMIHYSKLKLSKDNFYSTEDIKEFADILLLSGGIKQNLLYRTIDGEMEVIAGHKRLLAATYNVERGHEDFVFVPCKEEDENDLMAAFNLIVTNSSQRERTEFEKMQEVIKLKEIIPKLVDDEELKGRVLREVIAKEMKLSTGKIGQYEAINNNLVPEGKEKFKDEELGITAAYEISKLPEEEQRKILSSGEKIQAKDIGKVSLNDEEMKVLINLGRREQTIDVLTYNNSKTDIIQSLKNIYGESRGAGGGCRYNFRYSGKITIQVEAYDQKELSWNEFANILIDAFGRGELKTTLPIDKASPMEEECIINALKSYFTELQTNNLIDAYKAAGTTAEEINILKDFILSDLEQKEIMHQYKKIVFQDDSVRYYSQLNGEPKRIIPWEGIAGLFGKALEREWVKKRLATVSESDTKLPYQQPPEEPEQSETVFQFLRSADIIDIAKWFNESFICPHSPDTCPQRQKETLDKAECQKCWLSWLRSEKEVVN